MVYLKGFIDKFGLYTVMAALFDMSRFSESLEVGVIRWLQLGIETIEIHVKYREQIAMVYYILLTTVITYFYEAFMKSLWRFPQACACLVHGTIHIYCRGSRQVEHPENSRHFLASKKDALRLGCPRSGRGL